MPEKNSKIVRIGLISRVDFGSDGFRRGLLEHAAGIFRDEDVDFVILAGGLVSARAIKERDKRLTKAVKGNDREIRAISDRLEDIDDELLKLEVKETLNKKERSRKGELTRERKKLEPDLGPLRREAENLARQQLALHPKQMADELNELMPRWTGAGEKPVVLYVVTSPSYDDVVGQRTADFLMEGRSTKEIRVLPPGAARIPLWPGKPFQKELEVLTPEKMTWLRGDYYSTPIERVIKDKLKQTSQPTAADIIVAGCFGSTILKPQGELPTPYVAVPALHRIEELRVSENQIGVRVMDVAQDSANPVVRTYNLKDMVSRERSFISVPDDLKPEAAKVVDFLKREGRRATGVIASGTGLSREVVQKTLESLRVKKGERRRSWPGVVYYEHAERWDFDVSHVQRNLRYVPPKGERKVDRLVAAGCVHAGSSNTDYLHWKKVGEVILATGARHLLLVGDEVEGIKHNLALRGEIIDGINVTAQEALMSWMLHESIVDVFKALFEKNLAELLKKTKTPSQEQLEAAVDASLVEAIVITGNHDLWMKDVGWTPLAFLKGTTERLVTDALSRHLDAKGLTIGRLPEIVRNKIIFPDRGLHVLPSGLKLAMMHPHMSRTKTTSIRLQEMLEKARDCQIVAGANFHVAEALEHWEPKLGQRVCIELGTMKHRSDFEDNKLKTCDQGFGALTVESVDGKIVSTEASFHSNDKVDLTKMAEDNVRYVRDALDKLRKAGIKY